MDEHERWLREHGLGKRLDNRPKFLNYCDCDGNNMEDVCRPSRCVYYEECQRYFGPFAEDLEKIMTIGEI